MASLESFSNPPHKADPPPSAALSRQWWDLAGMLIVRYNDDFFNFPEGDEDACHTVGYPAWWLEMIGFGARPPLQWLLDRVRTNMFSLFNECRKRPTFCNISLSAHILAQIPYLLPHVATFCHDNRLIIKTCGTSVMTPFVLTPSGSCRSLSPDPTPRSVLPRGGEEDPWEDIWQYVARQNQRCL